MVEEGYVYPSVHGGGGCVKETKHVNTIYVFNKFGDKLGFPSNPHWMAFHTP